MKVDIKERRQNPSLKREELTFEAEVGGATPNRKELRAKIAALTGSDENLVIVGKIAQGFGSKVAKGEARLYKAKEDMDSTELEYAVNRNLGIKKKEGEGGGKETPPTEAPAPAEGEGKAEEAKEEKAEEKKGEKEA